MKSIECKSCDQILRIRTISKNGKAIAGVLAHFENGKWIPFDDVKEILDIFLNHPNFNNREVRITKLYNPNTPIETLLHA